MAGIGQQALVRAHQGLDALGGAVEGGADRRHLIAAGFVHPVAERAAAESLNALF